MTKEFESFNDWVGLGREIKCTYHGKNDSIYLEGMVLSEEGNNLIVGVSLWEQDLANHSYDNNRKSLDIWYQAPPPDEIRCLALIFQEFTVPKEIEGINVYDVGQDIE